jgi:hypothetical protein
MPYFSACRWGDQQPYSSVIFYSGKLEENDAEDGIQSSFSIKLSIYSQRNA